MYRVMTRMDGQWEIVDLALWRDANDLAQEAASEGYASQIFELLAAYAPYDHTGCAGPDNEYGPTGAESLSDVRPGRDFPATLYPTDTLHFSATLFSTDSLHFPAASCPTNSLHFPPPCPAFRAASCAQAHAPAPAGTLP